MTSPVNLANQLAAVCQSNPSTTSALLRCVMRYAVLNGSPTDLRLLASYVPRELPALASSLQLLAEDMERAPLNLGGK